MAESLRRRLRELERVIGADGVCQCGRCRVSYVDGDWLPGRESKPEPERCPVCGLPVPVVVVEYVSNWRGVR